MTPVFRNLLIDSSLMPSSASISTLCSPSPGAGRGACLASPSIYIDGAVDRTAAAIVKISQHTGRFRLRIITVICSLGNTPESDAILCYDPAGAPLCGLVQTSLYLPAFHRSNSTFAHDSSIDSVALTLFSDSSRLGLRRRKEETHAETHRADLISNSSFTARFGRGIPQTTTPTCFVPHHGHPRRNHHVGTRQGWPQQNCLRAPSTRADTTLPTRRSALPRLSGPPGPTGQIPASEAYR